MGRCDRANNLISFQFPLHSSGPKRPAIRNAAIFDYLFPQRKTIILEKLERNHFVCLSLKLHSQIYKFLFHLIVLWLLLYFVHWFHNVCHFIWVDGKTAWNLKSFELLISCGCSCCHLSGVVTFALVANNRTVYHVTFAYHLLFIPSFASFRSVMFRSFASIFSFSFQTSQLTMKIQNNKQKGMGIWKKNNSFIYGAFKSLKNFVMSTASRMITELCKFKGSHQMEWWKNHCAPLCIG